MRLEITKAEGKTKATRAQALDALKTLRGFIGRSQGSAIAIGCTGEEKQFFFDKLVQMAALVSTMPKTYEQDGKGEATTVTLHYFTSQFDWYITERDKDAAQHQAFGLADLGSVGDGPELGYISLVEILSHGAELDLHFTPCTLGEIKAKAERP
jgi:hypothetical protein